MKIEKCNICPRKNNAVCRKNNGDGICKMGNKPKLARASAYCLEEPCINGTKGSGIFCGIENSFIQQSDSVQSKYTPDFDAEGI